VLDRYFDELEVGEVIVGSRGRTLTEFDVAMFSAVSGDWHPLHNDDEYARRGPFGARIAHGLLVLAMMTGMAPISGSAVAALYGFERIRFVHPVAIGDTIGYRLTVEALQPRAGRGVADLAFDVVNQEDRVCATGVIKLLLNYRPVPPAP
jgi:acyl dehydratase